MAEQNGFILYLDQYAPISGMTLEQKGMLLEAMFAYHSGEPYEVTDPVVSMAFGFFRAGFERERQKYAQICTRRKTAINARWDKARGACHDTNDTNVSAPIQNDTNDTNVFLPVQTIPYQDQDQDQDKKDTPPYGGVVDGEPPTPPPPAASRPDPDTREPAAPQVPPCPCEKIRDMYHAAFPEHPRVALLNAKRRGAIKARWGDAGKRLRELKRPDSAAERLAYFQRLFDKAAMSDFLTGKKAFRDGSVYRVDFDKLMSPGGFMGVIEGKYDNRQEAW